MKGTRPLDNSDIRIVATCFDGTFEVRNRGLFMLGVSTGTGSASCYHLRIVFFNFQQVFSGNWIFKKICNLDNDEIRQKPQS